MTATTIPTARLGAAGPEVGVQGLGCMGMSFAYGPPRTRSSPRPPWTAPSSSA